VKCALAEIKETYHFEYVCITRKCVVIPIVICKYANVIIIRDTWYLWRKFWAQYYYNSHTKYNLLHLYQDIHCV